MTDCHHTSPNYIRGMLMWIMIVIPCVPTDFFRQGVMLQWITIEASWIGWWCRISYGGRTRITRMLRHFRIFLSTLVGSLPALRWSIVTFTIGWLGSTSIARHSQTSYRRGTSWAIGDSPGLQRFYGLCHSVGWSGSCGTGLVEV